MRAGECTGLCGPCQSRCRRIFIFFFFSTGDDRDRTDNLCLARAALSQLSYVPEFPADSPSRLSTPQQYPAATSVNHRTPSKHCFHQIRRLSNQQVTLQCKDPHITKPVPVGVRGLEPRTSALSELRSNHLSYTPRRLFPNSGADIVAARAANVQFVDAYFWVFLRIPSRGFPGSSCSSCPQLSAPRLSGPIAVLLSRFCDFHLVSRIDRCDACRRASSVVFSFGSVSISRG